MASKRTSLPRKKNNAKGPVPEASETTPDIYGNYLEAYWPKSFAPMRTALFMIGASIVLAIMVFGTAGLGGFTAVKISLAETMNLARPDLVSQSNFDLAFVIWGIGTVIFAGIIHPVLGIGLVLLARPWLDGYTFFTENTYFLWSIFALALLWLIRALVRREPMRNMPPVLMLGGLLLVMLLVTRHSHQYYNTYQHLWLWAGYAMLFLLVVNTPRSRASWGVLFAIFMVGMGIQAVFSILHFEYLLPHLRRYILQNPAAMQQHFGTTTLTPDLAHRLNINRAFGTMLFPNALSAFLLLGIPVSLVMLVPWWRALNDAYRRANTQKEAASAATTSDRVVVLTVAVLVGMAFFLSVVAMGHFPRSYLQSPPSYLNLAPLTAFGVIGACCVALTSLLLMSKYGLACFWFLCRFVFIAALTPVLLYSLWITYSRGAYLGLIAAGIWAVILWQLSPERLRGLTALSGNPVLRNTTRVLLLCILVVGGAVYVGQAHTHAQQAPPRAPGPSGPSAPSAPSPVELSEEGIMLTAADLANPATMRLRFGYWRVAWRMFRDNWLTGVGPGNFAIAYPAYQYIGAGDVKEAHNGFLQLFSETGLFGGILFAAFWLYFGLWGAWRVIHETNRVERWLLLGLYTGITAFCIHAVVDISFSHPSLVMLAMAFTGLFYARAALSEPCVAASDDHNGNARKAAAPTWHAGHGAVAIVLIIFSVVCSGAVFRPYVQQLALCRLGFLNMNPDTELGRRMRTGQFLIAELGARGERLRLGEEPGEPPRLAVARARMFLDEQDFEDLANFCAYYQPSPHQPNRFLRLPPGELPPRNGLMVVAHNPFQVRNRAVRNIAAWIDELERIDRWFPHNHELAMNLVRWYELHVHYVHGPPFEEQRSFWIERYLGWSETLVRRNPFHADVRMFHAQALLWPAINVPESYDDTLIQRSLEHWEKALTLAAITPGHRFSYAYWLTVMANYYSERGDAEYANELMDRARALHEEAQELQQRRIEAQMYP